MGSSKFDRFVEYDDFSFILLPVDVVLDGGNNIQQRLIVVTPAIHLTPSSTIMFVQFYCLL